MQASILIQTHLLCWKQGVNVFNSIEVSSIQRVLAGENLKKLTDVIWQGQAKKSSVCWLSIRCSVSLKLTTSITALESIEVAPKTLTHRSKEPVVGYSWCWTQLEPEEVKSSHLSLYSAFLQHRLYQII